MTLQPIPSEFPNIWGKFDFLFSQYVLPPFGPIEGHKWFFQISSQLESQKNWLAFISFGKTQFWPSWIWDTLLMTLVSGDLRCRVVKTGFWPEEINADRFFWNSRWLEIWKNQLCPSIRDRMKGAWLWTQKNNNDFEKTDFPRPGNWCKMEF